MVIKTDTPDRLLDRADRLRQVGPGDAADAREFYRLCEDAARAGEIRFDRISSVFRHLMYHAGAIRPANQQEHERFRVCPLCEAILTVEKGEERSA